MTERVVAVRCHRESGQVRARCISTLDVELPQTKITSEPRARKLFCN